MEPPSPARRESVQWTIDRIVHHFKTYRHMSRKHPTLTHFWPPRGHLWVRVHLQRSIGWSFATIERVYGIPLRTAKQWQREGKGTGLMERAVRMGEFDRKKVVEVVLGITVDD